MSAPGLRLPSGLRGVARVGFDAIEATAAEPISWAWEGVCTDEHHVEIAGPSYSGKTTLAFLLAAARAHVGPPVCVLGRKVTPTNGGRFVLVIEEENSLRSSRGKLHASCEMLGIDPRETMDRIILIGRSGIRVGGNDDKWRALHELASEGHIGCTFLDSRARIFPGESNREEHQALAGREITSLINASCAEVYVISHTRKGAADSLDDVSGSHQRAAAADVVLLVTAERAEGKVLASKVVFAKLRDGDDEHPAPVTFAIAKNSDGRWQCAVDDEVRPIADEAPHARVLAFLLTNGEQTKNQIREALAMNAKTLETALTVLFAEKKIAKRAKVVRGRSFDAFTAKAGSFEDLLGGAAASPANRSEDDNAVF